MTHANECIERAAQVRHLLSAEQNAELVALVREYFATLEKIVVARHCSIVAAGGMRSDSPTVAESVKLISECDELIEFYQINNGRRLELIRKLVEIGEGIDAANRSRVGK